VIDTVRCTTVTVLEVLAAAYCGLQVVGMSLITNKCVAPEDVATGAAPRATPRCWRPTWSRSCARASL